MHRWIAAAALAAPLAAFASPGPMTWQGRLLDSTGEPLQGDHEITFRLYDAATNGTAVWSETHTLVLAQGYASTVLGGQTDLATAGLDTGDRWLAIELAAVELSRQLLSAVPRAAEADNAGTLEGQTRAQIVSQTIGQLGQQTVTVGGLAVQGVGTVINSSGQWVGSTSGLGTTLDCYATGWGSFSGCTTYPSAPIPGCAAGYVYAGIHQYHQSDAGCGVSASTNARMQARCCRVQ